MSIFIYSLRNLFYFLFSKRSHYRGKKEFYKRQVNFTFLDLMFTPEGNKKASEAEIQLKSEKPFNVFGFDSGTGRNKIFKKFGTPNYIYRLKKNYGLKLSGIFYKIPFSGSSCLLQFYFVDDKLYCIDMRFAANTPGDEEINSKRLNDVFGKMLSPETLEDITSLLLDKGSAHILGPEFYISVENYFNFKIRIIPYFGKYRSINPLDDKIMYERLTKLHV